MTQPITSSIQAQHELYLREAQDITLTLLSHSTFRLSSAIKISKSLKSLYSCAKGDLEELVVTLDNPKSKLLDVLELKAAIEKTAKIALVLSVQVAFAHRTVKTPTTSTSESDVSQISEDRSPVQEVIERALNVSTTVSDETEQKDLIQKATNYEQCLTKPLDEAVNVIHELAFCIKTVEKKAELIIKKTTNGTKIITFCTPEILESTSAKIELIQKRLKDNFQKKRDKEVQKMVRLIS